MPKAVPAEHGTVRGYRQHHAARTIPCRPCCHAWSAWHKLWRDKGRCAKGLGWPLEAPPLEVSRAD